MSTQTILSSRQVGQILGLQPASLRSLARRRPDLRAPRELWPDARTPMWDAAAVKEYGKNRPAHRQTAA